jgi:2-amino-4-hydroxy-6-hydroxymethyldihydropteridine diphosphokinase
LTDPAANCLRAIKEIEASGSIKVLSRSSLYRTEPIGDMNQPWFVNCVIEARTSLNPHELLIVLQDLEKKMGRVRIQKWGPRLIDLDILFYGQAIIQDRDLIIPHPELHKRRFVLVPFNEIASYWIHPVFGISVKGLLDRVLDESKVERIQGE